jgi:hypothetical protein
MAEYEKDDPLRTDQHVDQMGADIAIQFMLMTLFRVMSEMSEDPSGFRSDVHKALIDLAATYKLPPLPEGAEAKIRTAAKKVIDGVMLNAGEEATLN